MKHKLLSTIFALCCTLSAIQSQNKLQLNQVQVLLQNRITPEVKAFLTSDSVYDRSKKNYLELCIGLEFFDSYKMPEILKNAFLDPLVYGLSIEKSEFVRFMPDSNTISNVFIYTIEDFELFKSKLEKDKLAHFEIVNGMTELYKNTAFIKGKQLIHIYSEDAKKHRYDYNNTYTNRDNRIEAEESSYNVECTEKEYQEYLATPKHLRKDPNDLKAISPTVEQVKEAKMLDMESYTYNYSSEEEEDPLYAVEQENSYGEEVIEENQSNNPLSFYKGYKKNYESYSQADSTATEADYVVEEAAYAVDSAVACYDEAEYPNYEYTDETLLSKKDQRKLKKIRAKEKKILAKSSKNKGDYDEVYVDDNNQMYDNEENEPKEYREIYYYKLLSLFENKKYILPFLKNEYTLNSTEKSYIDYMTSKAATSIWVNQESIAQLFLSEIVREMDLEDKISSSKSEYLKNSAMLIELDYSSTAKCIATLKGYGNSAYMSDVKAIFNPKIPANWLANVPENAAVVGGLVCSSAKLYGFYKNYLMNCFSGASKDTLAKEIFTLLEIALDEDAIAKTINGNSLVYVNGTNTHTEYFSSYVYDENYNYNTVDSTRQVTNPSFAYFMGFDDKKATQSYLNLIQYFGYLKLENGIYSVYSRNSKTYGFNEKNNEHIYISFINNALVVSNDSLMLLSIIKNKSTNNIKLAKTFDENKVYLKLDFEQVAKTLAETKNELSDEWKKRFKDFKKLEIKGMNFEENKFTISANLEQLGNEQNQLYALFRLFK